MQVGKEFLIDEVAEVVAGHRLVVVELAGLVFRRGPAFPAVGLVEDKAVFLTVERSFVGAVLFQTVEVLQERSHEVCSV